jgi:hypothetical protein
MIQTSLGLFILTGAILGLSEEDFVHLVEECLRSEAGSSKPTAVFVECHQAWTGTGAAELKLALGIEVEAVVIPDSETYVKKMIEKMQAADIVVTTHHHFNEIRGMLHPSKFIFPLDQHSSYDMIATLASMKDTRIAAPFLGPSMVKTLGLSTRAAGCQVKEA